MNKQIIAKKTILGKNLCYNIVMKDIYNCIECGKPLSGKQRSFCSITCKNDHFLNYETVKLRATTRKRTLINAMKGGCHRCGYDTSLDALSFYDEVGQSLHIDTNILANSNYNRLLGKLQNCQVLCRNCVEEINSQNTQNMSENTEIHEEIVQKSYSDISEKTRRKFEYNFVQNGPKIDQILVLGVSGGVDSIVMLDLMASHHPADKLTIVHVNHALRPEADVDELFVKNMAQKYGISFLCKKLQPHTTGNQEEYFRDQRRQYLLEVAEDLGANFVALAHNADDQAETFIMNAMRGSGPAGLGAMKLRDKKLFRPLLDVSRAEIMAYAQTQKLTWHEDLTNADISYNRNYIRHRILPLMAQLNPDYLNSIQRTTKLQRRLDARLKAEALYVIEESQSGSENTIFIKNLRTLDKPLLYEVLGLLYEKTRGDRQNLSLSHLDAVTQLITAGAGTASLDLPGEVVARRRYDKLDFYPKKAHNIHSTPSTKKLLLGDQNFGAWHISVTKAESLPASNHENLVIDADFLPKITVRTREPGDRIASTGLAGRKKIQDLFIDAKIDREKRDTWPIIVQSDTNEVLWVPGLAKKTLDIKTKKLLTLNIVEAAHETTKEK